MKATADAHDGFLPFHRISCSPLEVLTFTPKGPRFSDGPIFWLPNVVTFVTVRKAPRSPLQPSGFECHFSLAQSIPPDKSLTFASLLRASVRANSSKPRP
ncbi:hypothetical protein EH240_31235 [Mesorhizobium tamadayense]|uniref:Uncharacterized protein n=1 Tax=Mesorhizobium tamadayense TaxID=425306 RepID=A0A3P3F0J3_9HYPH|nr:hypothetical protein EH240_31235 [Mesorhizobium tamadayense]